MRANGQKFFLIFGFLLLIIAGPVAKAQNDDAYDPFADFSEFEDSAQEEADINFFQNGRFFTIGFMGGLRSFTQELSNIYSSGPAFGLYISYFFDLRFALQVSYLTGDYNLHLPFNGGSADGNVGLSSIGVDLKYYLNTQNVTKGLADLNPYILVGFSQNYRSVTLADEDAFAKDSAIALDGGLGIEIPMLRNKMFFGFQALYHLINFADEKREFVFDDINGTPVATGVKPIGDTYTLLGILGVNF